MVFEKRSAGALEEYMVPGSGDGDYEDLGQLEVGEAVSGKVVDVTYYTFEGKNYETHAPEQKAVVGIVLINEDDEKARVSGFDSNIYGKQMIQQFTTTDPQGNRIPEMKWVGKHLELARVEMTSKKGNAYYPLGVKELD